MDLIISGGLDFIQKGYHLLAQYIDDSKLNPGFPGDIVTDGRFFIERIWEIIHPDWIGYIRYEVFLIDTDKDILVRNSIQINIVKLYWRIFSDVSLKF